MKILMLTDHFLPSLGGVERHGYTLARYLSKLSHEVHIVTSPSWNRDQDFHLDRDLKKLHKIRVFRALPRGTSVPLWSTTKKVIYSHSLAKYINKHANRYDIIHYHGTHQLLLRLAKSKTPLITSLHGIFPACALQSSKPCKKRSMASCAICDIGQNPRHISILPIMIPYYFSYYRLMEESLNNVNKVICVSEYVKEYVGRFLRLDNLITIYNFIDFDGEITPELTSSANFDIRNRLKLSSDANIITYFGSLSFNKGVDLLIEAFRILRKKMGENVYLLIGGDGPQRRQLENMARRIGNVEFIGFVPRKIQLATMKHSDVFVHPARYPDACPTAILEAMALGLPVVGTKIGGVPELIVDGKGGYLVNPNSTANLAAKISTILNSEMLKSKMKAFNLKWSRRFDVNRLAPKIIEVYETASV